MSTVTIDCLSRRIFMKIGTEFILCEKKTYMYVGVWWVFVAFLSNFVPLMFPRMCSPISIKGNSSMTLRFSHMWVFPLFWKWLSLAFLLRSLWLPLIYWLFSNCHFPEGRYIQILKPSDENMIYMRESYKLQFPIDII